jgi:hypothetical protein
MNLRTGQESTPRVVILFCRARFVTSLLLESPTTNNTNLNK